MVDRNIHIITDEIVKQIIQMLDSNNNEDFKLAMEILFYRDKNNKESEANFKKIIEITTKETSSKITKFLTKITIEDLIENLGKKK